MTRSGNSQKMTLTAPYPVRFIKFMPFVSKDIGTGNISSQQGNPIACEHIGTLTPVKMKKAGPALYFSFEGAAGVVGFISPISNHFCKECNRLRLTADGKLRPCLFSETEIDLKPALRSGGTDDDEIRRLIELSIVVKPKGHSMRLEDGFPSQDCSPMHMTQNRQRRPMSRIGG